MVKHATKRDFSALVLETQFCFTGDLHHLASSALSPCFLIQSWNPLSTGACQEQALPGLHQHLNVSAYSSSQQCLHGISRVTIKIWNPQMVGSRDPPIIDTPKSLEDTPGKTLIAIACGCGCTFALLIILTA